MSVELECAMYCRAVNCDKPTAAVIDTLQHGWIELCATHAVLQLATMHGTIQAPS